MSHLVSVSPYLSRVAREASSPVGEDSETVAEMWQQVSKHFAAPASRNLCRWELEFETLCDAWTEETALLSMTQDMILHPAYQRVIGLGRRVIPLLLAELGRGSYHWDHALQAITGVNPVSPENTGYLDRVAEDWLRWGRENGIRW